MSDVHLHGAFAHSELIGDYLVLFALLQQPEYLLLTSRERDWISSSVRRAGRVGRLPQRGGEQNARWNISTAPAYQSNGSNCLRQRQASGKIAAGPEPGSQEHLRA